VKTAWRNLDEEILKAIRGLAEHGFDEPTIRSVYYVMGTANLIKMTDSGYKSLDAKIVEMRRSEAIPWGFFAVKRGTSIEAGVPIKLPGNFVTTIPYVTEGDWAEFWIESVRKAAESYRLPRWFGQENLVEVWVEKDGLLGATANWLEDREVTVRAPQGYGAWEFVHKSLQKIGAELRDQEKERVVILYLGDLDPSGKDIPRFMSEEMLTEFTDKVGAEVEFREIALSPEQVRRYNLPQTPESKEVIRKILRDSRLNWYRERYPPDMFVELDAFYSLATKAVQQLLRDSVDELFDDGVHDESRKEERRRRKRIAKDIDREIQFKGPPAKSE
jgi:hypothetical protein